MNTDIIEKIKNLLALAASDNIHEAAAATAAATSLMFKHRVSEAMLEHVEEKMDEVDLESSGRLASWKTALASHLAEANGVFCYTSRLNGVTHTMIAGQESDVQATLYLYRYCIRAIEGLTLTAGRGMGRKWCTDYRHGCVAAVGKMLKQAAEEEERAARSSAQRAGTSLVVLDSALAKIAERKYEAQVWLQSAKGVRTKNTSLNLGRRNFARARGLHDGQSIDVTGKHSRLGKGILALGSGS